MSTYVDQLGRPVFLSSIPQRIVSLVPSQTELLFDVGLDNEVVGITKFCIHPEEWFRTKQRVGGTKTVHIDKVLSLKPDLVIANKEENVQEQVESLAKHFPVWVSDVNNLEEALAMMQSIGEMTGRSNNAKKLVTTIRQNFAQLQTPDSPAAAKADTQPQTAYLIWKEPYMTVGGDTFIHHMLQAAGFQNCFAGRQRYPQITIEELQQAGCELLLLSSEPFPFQQKHIDELQAFLPHTKILLVDGELFSWYGSRLLKAPAYFQELQRQVARLA